MVLNAGRYVVLVLRQHNRLLHSPDRTKTHARVTGGCWHLMMQTLRQEDPKSIQRAQRPFLFTVKHPNCSGALNFLLDVFLFL